MTTTDRPPLVSDREIDAHELLDAHQRKICKSLRGQARKDGDPFSMLDFARVALRSTGTLFAETLDSRSAAALTHDRAHQRAAILLVHEMLRASKDPTISEWPDLPEALRMLVVLSGDLP